MRTVLSIRSPSSFVTVVQRLVEMQAEFTGNLDKSMLHMRLYLFVFCGELSMHRKYSKYSHFSYEVYFFVFSGGLAEHRKYLVTNALSTYSC